MMNEIKISVEIRPFTKPNSHVRAYADVTLVFTDGTLAINGFAIIEKDGKAPFIGFPSKAGTIHGKFFPIVDLQGEIRTFVCKAILDAYGKHGRS
jgi:DNA-binding cell septation regulator SpoVG